MFSISRNETPSQAKLSLWIGRVMTALVVLFMIFDASIKLLQLQVVADAMAQLGYKQNLGFLIGVIEAILLVLYIVPRTAVLGAVLLTGLYGGAIASHLRIESPLLSHTLFGVYLGLLAWGGLWLRDAKLRALFPVRG